MQLLYFTTLRAPQHTSRFSKLLSDVVFKEFDNREPFSVDVTCKRTRRESLASLRT